MTILDCSSTPTRHPKVIAVWKQIGPAARSDEQLPINLVDIVLRSTAPDCSGPLRSPRARAGVPHVKHRSVRPAPRTSVGRHGASAHVQTRTRMMAVGWRQTSMDSRGEAAWRVL
jgi:hypothetical protein